MKHDARLAVVAVLWAAPSLSQAQDGVTVRADVGPGYAQADGRAADPHMSPDGRWVVFHSYATNLVAGDTNGKRDVFLHDRWTGSTILVSTDASGVQASKTSRSGVVSDDGVHVAFRSRASELAPGGSGSNEFNVYRKDLQTGQVVRVSNPGEVVESFDMSGDGRYVAYEHRLTIGPMTCFFIELRDIQTGALTAVTPPTGDCTDDGFSIRPSISSDGRCVAFESSRANLVAGFPGGPHGIFVFDALTGATTLESVSPAGLTANGTCTEVSLSADGSFLSFDSTANNLAAGDSGATWDVFLRDVDAGVTTRITAAEIGNQKDSRGNAISDDGQVVVFRSDDSGLVPGDTNGEPDVFSYDHGTGQIRRMSIDSHGQQVSQLSPIVFGVAQGAIGVSADGSIMAFAESSPELVAEDTNGVDDVFVRVESAESTSYCTSGTAASGCRAVITSAGTPSATAPSGFFLQVFEVEGSKDGLFFVGTNGRQAAPWGSGTSFQCVRPPVARGALLASVGTTGGCDGAFSYDMNARWTAKPAQNPGAGSVAQAQFWHRDPGNTSNQKTSLSNALELTVAP